MSQTLHGLASSLRLRLTHQERGQIVAVDAARVALVHQAPAERAGFRSDVLQQGDSAVGSRAPLLQHGVAVITELGVVLANEQPIAERGLRVGHHLTVARCPGHGRGVVEVQLLADGAGIMVCPAIGHRGAEISSTAINDAAFRHV